jgi:hypothetical protein
MRLNPAAAWFVQNLNRKLSVVAYYEGLRKVQTIG